MNRNRSHHSLFLALHELNLRRFLHGYVLIHIFLQQLRLLFLLVLRYLSVDLLFVAQHVLLVAYPVFFQQSHQLMPIFGYGLLLSINVDQLPVDHWSLVINAIELRILEDWGRLVVVGGFIDFSVEGISFGEFGVGLAGALLVGGEPVPKMLHYTHLFLLVIEDVVSKEHVVLFDVLFLRHLEELYCWIRQTDTWAINWYLFYELTSF